jgi:hypothetical protein
MTLSLRYKPETFRRMDNALPIWPGHFASRPGATQIVSGPVSAAVEWDKRILFYRGAECVLWDQIEHPIGDSGASLDATAFQALIGNAEREDRLYVADGANPLWYVVHDPLLGYQRRTFANDLLDPAGAPYPVPIASAVETFRNRLWVIHAGNRAQHSDNDRPHYWDPTFTVELQSGDRSSLTALCAQEGYLAVGSLRALWQISGDSQFNWAHDYLVRQRGVAGPRGLDGNGTRLFYVSAVGVHEAGSDGHLGGNNLDKAFEVPDSSAHLSLSPDGRFLLLVIRSRLFVIHTASFEIGEIAEPVRGVITMGNHFGWYGDDGIWICNRSDGVDSPLAGPTRRVSTVLATWPETTDRRALLERVFLQAIGESDAPVTYTARVDDLSVEATVPGATASAPFSQLWDGSILQANEKPSRHEIPIYMAGHRFEHLISCAGRVELTGFKPSIRGRQ